MANCVSTARARADRGSDPPENHKKTEKTRPENHHAQEVVLLLKSVTKLQKKGALWDIFGPILMAKTAQAHDKPAHRSHHAQDSRKHDIFEGPGA